MHSAGLNTHGTHAYLGDTKEQIMSDDVSEDCNDALHAKDYASIARDDEINADLKHFGSIESVQENTKLVCKNDKEQCMLGPNENTKSLIFRQLGSCNGHLNCVTRVLETLSEREIMPRNEVPLSSSQTATTTVTATSINLLPFCDASFNSSKATFILSTDRDSGMGSPVNSSRSTRHRRRTKHKATSINQDVAGSTTATLLNLYHMHDGTIHPLKSQEQQMKRNVHLSTNDRLLKIISVQDETIRKHVSLLREKECQIVKIEEEKHRVRERKLGKNYLLETYFNTFDQAEYTDIEKNLRNVVRPFTPLEQDIHNEVIEEPDCQEMMTAGVASTSQEMQVLSTAELDGNKCASKALKTGYLDRHNANSAIKDNSPLYWLEKIHVLNKRLQYQEEFLLQLYIKVRKQQVKRAYQTKSGVLHQIDELDRQIATQVVDIHCVERQLLMANEQLKAKLGVLECLSNDFLISNQSTVISTDNGNAEPTDDNKKEVAKSFVPKTQTAFNSHILDKSVKINGTKCHISEFNNEDCMSKQSFLRQQLTTGVALKDLESIVSSKNNDNESATMVLPQLNLKNACARAVSSMTMQEDHGVSETINKRLPRSANNVYDITSLGTLV